MSPKRSVWVVSAFVLVSRWADAALTADALVAHWTFNEGAGTIVTDRSGNGHDAVRQGASYVESPRGYALRFDGVNDRVEYGNPAGLQVSGDLTLAVWLRTAPGEGVLLPQ